MLSCSQTRRGCRSRKALQYNNGYVENVQSYVNVINTVNGEPT